MSLPWQYLPAVALCGIAKTVMAITAQRAAAAICNPTVGDAGEENKMCTNNLTDGGDGSIIIDWTPEGSDPGTHGDDFIIDFRPADGEDTSIVIDWRPDPGSGQSGPGDEAGNGGFRGGVTVAAGDINDGSTDSREAANSVAMESITIAHEGWLLI